MTRTPAEKLAGAIRAEIVNCMTFTGAVTVDALTSRPWASITFSGDRHRLRISFDGPGAVGAAADLLQRLEALEVAIPGLLLADLALLAESRSDDGRRAWLDLEALTIDD